MKIQEARKLSTTYPRIIRDYPERTLEHPNHMKLYREATHDGRAGHIKGLIMNCLNKRIYNEIKLGKNEEKIYSLIINQVIARHVPNQSSVLNPHKGIILSGSVGVGKTTFLESVAEAEQYLVNVLRNPTMEHSEEALSQALKARYTVSVPEERRLIIANSSIKISQDLIHSPMLFDEFGDTGDDNIKFMGNTFNFVEDVLYKRHQQYVKANLNGIMPAITMLTTNLTKKEIIERYSLKVADRLFEMCDIVEWEGESKRK